MISDVYRNFSAFYLPLTIELTGAGSLFGLQLCRVDGSECEIAHDSNGFVSSTGSSILLKVLAGSSQLELASKRLD